MPYWILEGKIKVRHIHLVHLLLIVYISSPSKSISYTYGCYLYPPYLDALMAFLHAEPSSFTLIKINAVLLNEFILQFIIIHAFAFSSIISISYSFSSQHFLHISLFFFQPSLFSSFSFSCFHLSDHHMEFTFINGGKACTNINESNVCHFTTACVTCMIEYLRIWMNPLCHCTIACLFFFYWQNYCLPNLYD